MGRSIRNIKRIKNLLRFKRNVKKINSDILPIVITYN